MAKDGVVTLALCNAGYLDLLLDWKASVDRLNITNYVIVPNDIKAAQQLSFLGTHRHPPPAPASPVTNDAVLLLLLFKCPS